MERRFKAESGSLFQNDYPEYMYIGENNWRCIHNIEDGWYAVCEENNPNVTYCINQGSEVSMVTFM